MVSMIVVRGKWAEEQVVEEVRVAREEQVVRGAGGQREAAGDGGTRCG